jgi:hypothetical protein
LISTYKPEILIDGGCPDNWYPYQNRCFKKFKNEKLSWEDAKQACEIEDSYLATVAGN